MDNNQVSDNLVGYQPSPDAIQEFNMITQNAPAEFGNFSGGVVSVSLKSGTNQYHGDAFEFFRNNILNANSWQNGLVAPGSPAIAKAALRWNQYGATFGGPIIKNKLFFFTDYQGRVSTTPPPQTNSRYLLPMNGMEILEFSAPTPELLAPAEPPAPVGHS